jgi:cell wall-associated NlpC family hydrolase
MTTNNNSGTFVYSPDISVAVYNINGETISLDSDIISFSMDREINQTSTFTCTLNNHRKKYTRTNSNGNRLINTMDRITVFLKRTNFIQCFTGLVTYAPIETLIPVPVTINASCTMYIIQQTYWDDTLIDYQSLLLNYMDPVAFSPNQTVNDGGIAQAIVNVLTKVAGWNTNSIHIQAVPENFVRFASNAFTSILSANQSAPSVYNTLSQVLGTDGIVSGKNLSSNSVEFENNQTAKAVNAPDGGVGVQINASKAVSFVTSSLAGGKKDFPGPNPANPVTNLNLINEDIFYFSAPFSYIKMGNKNISENATQWLAHNPIKNSYDGRLLLITNQKTSKVVALRATSVPQVPNSNAVKGSAAYDPNADYIQCHPGVIAYLNGSIGDPTAWKSSNNNKNFVNSVDITFEWVDNKNKNIISGVQPDININNANSYYGYNSTSQTNPNSIDTALNKLIHNARGQIGDPYVWGSEKAGSYGKKNGSFDCSGLTQWAYSTIGIPIGRTTLTQCGPTDGSKPNQYGQWISNTQQPQRGDLLFWDVPSDGGNQPAHVTMMSINFGDPGPNGEAPDSNIGYSIAANGTGSPLSEVPVVWDQILGGNPQIWGAVYATKGPNKGYQVTTGAKFIGARRPITLHHGWGTNSNQNYNPTISVNNTSNSNTPNTGTIQYDLTTASGRSSISLTNAYNTNFQSPNFNVTASVLQGNPQAFILDNPLMQDLQQIIGAGLRCFQSAPNGDFIAWFPDYFGVYGTQPALDISPVEIIDFEMYHDDTQLVTHVAVIGDTTGIGQQVSNVDQMVTQGIVSIQDVTTMQILFGQNTGRVKTLSANEQIVNAFLNRYGIRPSVSQQSIIHSHALEYIYALQTFMQSWVNQYIITLSLTFMPEIYPGMRISMTLDNEDGGVDNYQFYVSSVQHQGDRTGGFTTSVSLTAPIKNGMIMDYGLNFIS